MKGFHKIPWKNKRFLENQMLNTFMSVVSHSSMSRGEPFFALCSSFKYVFSAFKHLHQLTIVHALAFFDSEAGLVQGIKMRDMLFFKHPL